MERRVKVSGVLGLEVGADDSKTSILALSARVGLKGERIISYTSSHHSEQLWRLCGFDFTAELLVLALVLVRVMEVVSIPVILQRSDLSSSNIWV